LYLLLQNKSVITVCSPSVSSSPQFCATQSCWMLCTLVIAMGTFPYALRAVAIPWSLDQDRLWTLCWGGSMVFRQCFRLGDGIIFFAHVFLVFFSADEETKHVYALEYFVDVWFFSKSANTETFQMTMNYLFCDEWGYSHKNERGFSFAMSEAILTKKNYDFNDSKRTLLRQKNMDVYWRCSVIVHFRWYLNRMQFKPEGSYDVSNQMG
jgi:hypothetical protein